MRGGLDKGGDWTKGFTVNLFFVWIVIDFSLLVISYIIPAIPNFTFLCFFSIFPLVTIWLFYLIWGFTIITSIWLIFLENLMLRSLFCRFHLHIFQLMPYIVVSKYQCIVCDWHSIKLKAQLALTISSNSIK